MYTSHISMHYCYDIYIYMNYATHRQGIRTKLSRNFPNHTTTVGVQNKHLLVGVGGWVGGFHKHKIRWNQNPPPPRPRPRPRPQPTPPAAKNSKDKNRIHPVHARCYYLPRQASRQTAKQTKITHRRKKTASSRFRNTTTNKNMLCPI